MPELTTDEKNLTCLALDECAAGFSMTVTREQAEQIKELAACLRASRRIDEVEHIDIHVQSEGLIRQGMPGYSRAISGCGDGVVQRYDRQAQPLDLLPLEHRRVVRVDAEEGHAIRGQERPGTVSIDELISGIVHRQPVRDSHPIQRTLVCALRDVQVKVPVDVQQTGLDAADAQSSTHPERDRAVPAQHQ